MRQDINMDNAYVLIYNTTGNNSYALYNKRASDENNALDSYTIYGGENDPFEYVKLRIPRKKMKQVASDLMEPNAIVPNRNKIYINGVGRGSYVVSSSDLTGNECTITGYCQAHALTGETFKNPVSSKPFDLIFDILSGKLYGEYITGKLKYWCIKRDDVTDYLDFKEGDTLWYAIQVCAAYLGCRIFFTGEDAYLVDYRLAVNRENISWNSAGIGTCAPVKLTCTSGNILDDSGAVTGYYPDALADFGAIDLYTKDANRPEYGRCVGQVKLGNEGQTTIINQVIVKCKDGVETTAMYKEAQEWYNDTEKTKKEYTLDVLKQTPKNEESNNNTTLHHQGDIVASSIIDYRAESQQSVEFSMKEYQSIGGSNHWIPFFPPSSRVMAIDDDLDDIHVSNTSVINETLIKPQKLILSSYRRNFPEGTSTYKFGVISSVDLSQKLYDMSSVQQ